MPYLFCTPDVVVAITETWLTLTLMTVKSPFQATTFFVLIKTKMVVGSHAIQRIQFSSLATCKDLCSLSIKSLRLSISAPHLPSQFTLGCCYRLPNTKRFSLTLFFDQIECILPNRKHVVMTGDFNINILHNKTLLPLCWTIFLTVTT